MSGEVASFEPSRAAEAARRLAQYGPNDLAPKKQRSHVVLLLLQFENPLVAILPSATTPAQMRGILLAV